MSSIGEGLSFDCRPQMCVPRKGKYGTDIKARQRKRSDESLVRKTVNGIKLGLP